jgi:hypothetical protein
MARFIVDLEPEPGESGFVKLLKFVFWLIVIFAFIKMCGHR